MSDYRYRNCRFCKKSQRDTTTDGCVLLFKYEVRHYAHASCLATAKGVEAAREMVPEHQRRQFDAGLLDERFDSSDTAKTTTARRSDVLPSQDPRTGSAAVELRMAAKAWVDNSKLEPADDHDTIGMKHWARLAKAAVRYAAVVTR